MSKYKSTATSKRKQQAAERYAQEYVNGQIDALRPHVQRLANQIARALLERQSGSFQLQVRLREGQIDQCNVQTNAVFSLDGAQRDQ